MSYKPIRMALAFGFFLFLMGALTFILWLPATWPFLQGLISFSLLFWGLLILLIVYSERKARRELARALHDETSQE